MIYSNVEYIVLLLACCLACYNSPTTKARFRIILLTSFAFYAWAKKPAPLKRPRRHGPGRGSQRGFRDFAHGAQNDSPRAKARGLTGYQ
jgi:hypothetical protein